MGKLLDMPAGMRGDAVFSKEQGPPHFRHVLRRWWPPMDGKTQRKIMFIGHNPSDAGKTKNDPTIFKVCKFALAWGFNDVTMHNLMDRIGDDPDELLRISQNLVTPESAAYGVMSKRNYASICAASTTMDKIVCCWGKVHKTFQPVAWQVEADLRSTGIDLYAIDFNDDGSPKHPLYISDDATLKPWGEVDG